MIGIETKKGTEYMSLDEFSRWMCLVEAFHFIEEKVQLTGINIDNLLKPAAIERYIEERFPAMRYDVEMEYENGML
jgi:hypothetical protein